jgi:hypothetical protein
LALPNQLRLIVTECERFSFSKVASRPGPLGRNAKIMALARRPISANWLGDGQDGAGEFDVVMDLFDDCWVRQKGA